MSTRCQVRVTDGDDAITLYHHTDGYPSYMVPTIRKAWEEYGKGLEGARVYKVASMLCAVDPVVFEPLPYKDLHADIEYFYEINCKGKSHIGAEPVWTVKVFSAGFDFDNKKTEKERLTLLAKGKVNKLDGEEIERKEQEKEDNQ